MRWVVLATLAAAVCAQTHDLPSHEALLHHDLVKRMAAMPLVGDVLPIEDAKKMRKRHLLVTNRTGLYWTYRYQNKVIIPYEIYSGYSDEEVNTINTAITSIEQETRVVRFVSYAEALVLLRSQVAPSSDPINNPYENLNRVLIANGSGCYSVVGMAGGIQPLSLSKQGCVTVGTAIHELLHVLGFLHEQSRPDRDNYIVVHKDNILPQRMDQFNINNQSTDMGIAYELHSIMQYTNTAFAKDAAGALHTMDARSDPSIVLGGKQLLPSDTRQVRLLYRCADGARTNDTMCAEATCPCPVGESPCASDNHCEGYLVCNTQTAVCELPPNATLIPTPAPTWNLDDLIGRPTHSPTAPTPTPAPHTAAQFQSFAIYDDIVNFFQRAAARESPESWLLAIGIVEIVLIFLSSIN